MLIPIPIPTGSFCECKWGGFNAHANGTWGPTQQFKSSNFALVHYTCLFRILGNSITYVKPRPEAHMDMILFEVFWKGIDLIPQQQILQRHYLYYR